MDADELTAALAVAEVRVPSASGSCWFRTHGEPPTLPRDMPVYALGRLGDIYGPVPFEMIDPQAWRGNMLHASHDLVAFAPALEINST